MIIPFTQHTNSNGNILFRFEHLPTNKKNILDRIENPWMSTHEFDPLTEQLLKSKCTCPDFTINRMEDSDCKHIIESKLLLIQLNILKIK